MKGNLVCKHTRHCEFTHFIQVGVLGYVNLLFKLHIQAVTKQGGLITLRTKEKNIGKSDQANNPSVLWTLALRRGSCPVFWPPRD